VTSEFSTARKVPDGPTTPHWATVVVLYHPDEATIDSVLNLARWGYAPIAVVNAIDPGELERLRAAGLPGLIVNERNIGLATALNQGIERALALGAHYVLLLDQDSRPGETMGMALVETAVRAARQGARIGCVGPVLVDRKAPGPGEAMVAAAAAGTAGPLIPASSIATSGALVSADALHAAGDMWDALFIDGIDHEWCFRAHAAGYGVFVAAAVRMEHDMGEHGINFLGRYKPIHRSAFRHFYIVRNGLWLARRPYIPLQWRAVETAKLLYRIPVYLLVSSDRPRTARAILRGVAAGLLRAPRVSVKA
jgi:rhamnosyltransferase